MRLKRCGIIKVLLLMCCILLPAPSQVKAATVQNYEVINFKRLNNIGGGRSKDLSIVAICTDGRMTIDAANYQGIFNVLVSDGDSSVVNKETHFALSGQKITLATDFSEGEEYTIVVSTTEGDYIGEIR